MQSVLPEMEAVAVPFDTPQSVAVKVSPAFKSLIGTQTFFGTSTIVMIGAGTMTGGLLSR